MAAEGMTSKEKILRAFLSFVSRHVPLEQAQLATLGGRGIEAKLWEEAGISPDKGWLIERGRTRSLLITTHPYQVHNQLGTFDRILLGFGPDRARIDGFHLDLCGTLTNAAVECFAPIVPLVLASTGRCLAVTVADARRNLVLEQWPKFQRRGRTLLGAAFSAEIYRHLLEEQRSMPVNGNLPQFMTPFDPDKGARREYGLMLELIALIAKGSLPWAPIEIERYVYLSNYPNGGSPFRMRTYFFHFGASRRARSSANAFARAWVQSPLSFTNGNGSHTIAISEPEPEPEPVNQTLSPREDDGMGTIVAMGSVLTLDGYVAIPKTVYDRLMADSQKLASFSALVAKSGIVSAASGPASAVVEAPSAPPAPRKRWEDFTPAERAEWQLKAAEVRHASGGKFAPGQWEAMLKADFGRYTKKLGYALRAAIAVTTGKHRPSFEKKIRAVFGEGAKPYLDRLAKI